MLEGSVWLNWLNRVRTRDRLHLHRQPPGSIAPYLLRLSTASP